VLHSGILILLDQRVHIRSQGMEQEDFR